MPQFYNHHVGGVVSFAINKFVYICVNPKFDKKIRVSYSKTENVDDLDKLEHDLVRETLREWRVNEGIEITSISDIPGSGSGLGSSSAFLVGLVNALGKGGHPSIVAERAFAIELEKCGRNVGKQDHYASAYGGMNYMTFRKNRVEVETLYPSKDMEENLLLLYTGITRGAEEILKEQGDNFKRGDSIEAGKKLSFLASQFRNEWVKGGMNYIRMGEHLENAWSLKRQLSTVSNGFIDDCYKKAMASGAYGGKLLGAGGGGFLLFAAPFSLHAKITEATGLRRVDFKICHTGSEIIYSENKLGKEDYNYETHRY